MKGQSKKKHKYFETLGNFETKERKVINFFHYQPPKARRYDVGVLSYVEKLQGKKHSRKLF